MNVSVLSKDLTIEELKSHKDFLENFVQLISSKNRTYLFINRKKIKMQKIYYNLFKELLKYNSNTKELSIDSTYRGFLTNYKSPNFMQMDLAIVILTKKHSDKQKAIIKELIESKTPTIVISLCEHFYRPHLQLYLVHDTRGLYHFLYLLTIQKFYIKYSEFSKDYELTTKKFNFEELRVSSKSKN